MRNARSQEADFLITRDDEPWLIGDVKLSSTAIDKHLYTMSAELGDIPIIQIVEKTGVFETPNPKTLIISADRLLAALP